MYKRIKLRTATVKELISVFKLPASEKLIALLFMHYAREKEQTENARFDRLWCLVQRNNDAVIPAHETLFSNAVT